MGESAVDCAQLSTMPTVSLTIGGKVFDLAPEEVLILNYLRQDSYHVMNIIPIY